MRRNIEASGVTHDFTDLPAQPAMRDHTATFDYGHLVRDGEPVQSLDVIRQALSRLAEVAPPRAAIQISYPNVYAHWQEPI